ncbi:STAS domain-containing protein [Saccharopolyspora sp. CA-218241]|uniref:STAS domain-containing protein n=1 Tax=Saccharopolyspora sp. CA-218241 TaxID=3240027 RepID=UPI003D98425D
MAVDHPDTGTAVVTACGEIDAAGIDGFAEVLLTRTRGTVRVIVLDLRQVSFLCVGALEVLCRARLSTQHQGQDLRVVVTEHAVGRALDVVGLDDLPRVTALNAALDTEMERR